MTELKRLRTSKNLTQQEVADKAGISLRSYIMYENDENRSHTIKYRFLLQEIAEMNRIDEEHGILTIEDLTKICNTVFSEYNISYCYLFGSYAKGTATESSDVDLLVSGDISGLKFYELVERLRTALHKKVDLLDIKQILNNEDLANEILKEGIRVYG
ncbi:MAG: nucleotidyltransferase domain-containing protein [Lachnospiraceae bacterium]|nr:nucleotidyltransferase domain-containing protein [Lachnospiraceae bacterium]